MSTYSEHLPQANIVTRVVVLPKHLHARPAVQIAQAAAAHSALAVMGLGAVNGTQIRVIALDPADPDCHRADPRLTAVPAVPAARRFVFAHPSKWDLEHLDDACELVTNAVTASHPHSPVGARLRLTWLRLVLEISDHSDRQPIPSNAGPQVVELAQRGQRIGEFVFQGHMDYRFGVRPAVGAPGQADAVGAIRLVSIHVTPQRDVRGAQ